MLIYHAHPHAFWTGILFISINLISLCMLSISNLDLSPSGRMACIHGFRRVIRRIIQRHTIFVVVLFFFALISVRAPRLAPMALPQGASYDEASHLCLVWLCWYVSLWNRFFDSFKEPLTDNAVLLPHFPPLRVMRRFASASRNSTPETPHHWSRHQMRVNRLFLAPSLRN